MTINERAAQLRAAIDTYDAGLAPVNKAGRLLPGAKAELVAVDPVIEAANALLDAIGQPAPEPTDPCLLAGEHQFQSDHRTQECPVYHQGE